MKKFAFAALSLLLGTSALAASTDAPQTTDQKPAAHSRTKTVKKHASTPKKSEACEKVWVNTRTMIYHHSGSRWYGRTKQGAEMCEKEAIAEGARVSESRGE